MKLKAEHFQVYDLVTVCFDYASEILRTIYREPVQYIAIIGSLDSLDLLKMACRLQDCNKTTGACYDFFPLVL
jgi:hypothetical protein